jgi:hypothetical protein
MRGYTREFTIVQLICRFCMALNGLSWCAQRAWPENYPQWEVFITSHHHTPREILRLSRKTHQPHKVVDSWSREPVEVAAMIHSKTLKEHGK